MKKKHVQAHYSRFLEELGVFVGTDEETRSVRDSSRSLDKSVLFPPSVLTGDKCINHGSRLARLPRMW